MRLRREERGGFKSASLQLEWKGGKGREVEGEKVTYIVDFKAG